jgi:hypothetical protein
LTGSSRKESDDGRDIVGAAYCTGTARIDQGLFDPAATTTTTVCGGTPQQ